MSFLRNAWYVAASSDEVAQGLFHRTLLDEWVLLYRKQDGTPVALQNVCPHRFAPLHLGQRLGDTVECGYHGLVFDGTGACVFNPHSSGSVPRAARVKPYPVIERHRLLWIWMGDKPADPASLPNCEFVDTTDKSISTMDYMKIDANYKLVIDNILDLSHTDYLHKGSFGGNAGNKAKLEVIKVGQGIQVNRSFSEGKLSPVLSTFTEYRGPVDRWQILRWDPPTVTTLSTGAVPTGRPREEGFTYTPWHVLTPETEGTTHMFFGKARNFNLDDPEMDRRMMRDMRDPIYGEDKPMLEALHKIMGDRDFWSMNPVLLAGDSGAVQVRREIDRMIAAEQQAE
jgi:phenylpropionate dioxygenase-like ring-hydroxylating dioxygenase large terminal subunit